MFRVKNKICRTILIIYKHEDDILERKRLVYLWLAIAKNEFKVLVRAGLSFDSI